MNRKERITHLLKQEFSPAILIVEDESHTHRRPGVETHFYVLMVSNAFEAITRLERHRRLNTLLADEFKAGLHALSLYLYTEQEYAQRSKDPVSPSCQHHRTSTTKVEDEGKV